jgi:Protein of unknown function (DUF3800)
MKLIFFDEAKDDPNHHHYHIGAVCIDETCLTLVEEKLDSLSAEIFRTTVLSTETEFHAAEIFHRKTKFWSSFDFDHRIRIITRLAEILSMEEVLLIDIQINCSLLWEHQRADEIAFMYLCERANDLVKAKKALGMLIGDRESDRMAERFSTRLSNYRDNGTGYAFGRDINNLVDSVHFTHSHLSRFLQLADVYVWLLQFRLRNQDSTNERHSAILDIWRNLNLSPSKYKIWPPR